jgi:hypothetical protein
MKSYQCEHIEPRRMLAGPNLAWSSYLGGDTAGEIGYGIAFDRSGNAWVTGRTDSTDFAVGGFDTTYNGSFSDGFIAKINADGSLAWSSYLGGTEYDEASGIAIDAAGNAWVTGWTRSPDLAVGGFDTSYNGGPFSDQGDAFIAKINANGTLAWSSFLGGEFDDNVHAVAIDGPGNAWVTGDTTSSGWAVGGFDTSYNGSRDPFIAKIDANGTLAWSSYLGGTNQEYGNGIAIDGSGNAWVTGGTRSSGWASGGFDTSHNGGNFDAFVAKINADGTLAWSSYLGGGSDDDGDAIAIDGWGNAWVMGGTWGGGWAVGGFDTSFNGVQDAFISKINADGTLAWSSYLGGTDFELGNGIATDGLGNAWVTGETRSSGWAVGGFDTSYNGADEAFIAKVNADGMLAWSSFLGGSDHEEGYGIAIDGSETAWVTGRTLSAGWTVRGFDTSLGGGCDAFIAKIVHDTTPPSVTAASYFYETTPNSVRLTFTEDVSTSLSASDLLVTTVPGGAPVSVTHYTYDTATNTATFELPTPLADGNYRATLPANAVSDLASHPLAADYTLDFFFLSGDSNHDRHVDVSDLGILATNWQGSGKTFSQGDFNYDGKVDVTDLGLLATNWQHSVLGAAGGSNLKVRERLAASVLE